MRAAVGLALAIVLPVTALGNEVASAQEEVISGDLDLALTDGGFTWIDHESEASYHVFGSVVYLQPPSCAPARVALGSEVVEFDEELAADTTSYQLPRPTDDRLTWAKDVVFTIDALDEDANVIERDGYGSQADKFCTPEELAAAGAGASAAGGDPLALASAALAALGGIAIGGALLLRRRAA